MTYDTYYCIPSACSADEVERLGVAILSGLEVRHVVYVVFRACGVCIDEYASPSPLPLCVIKLVTRLFMLDRFFHNFVGVIASFTNFVGVEISSV